MASPRHPITAVSAVCKQAASPCIYAKSAASASTHSSITSLPRPTSRAPYSHFTQSASIASRSLPIRQSRTFLTHLRRQAQALKEQPTSSSTFISPKPAKIPRRNLQLTNLPYFVRRTGSNQLPVYLVTKAGGTKQLTKIQKTEGDLDALRDDLAHTLGIDMRSPDVSINRLTGHIIVKGWRKPEILKFLQERNF